MLLLLLMLMLLDEDEVSHVVILLPGSQGGQLHCTRQAVKIPTMQVQRSASRLTVGYHTLLTCIEDCNVICA